MKKTTKMILALLLAALVCMLCACGGEGEGKKTESSDATTVESAPAEETVPSPGVSYDVSGSAVEVDW